MLTAKLLTLRFLEDRRESWASQAFFYAMKQLDLKERKAWAVYKQVGNIWMAWDVREPKDRKTWELYRKMGDVWTVFDGLNRKPEPK